MINKVCSACRIDKPISEFYKQKYGKNGLRASCKSCCNKDSRLWFEANIIRDREKGRKWYQQNKEKRMSSINIWETKNIVKKMAQQAVHIAIRSKKLIRKPCAVCGNLKVDAHHPDYSRPLEVIWLCRKHHIEIHRKERDKK